MRIAVVTPRYGHEVAGGAERLARDYATHLARTADVTVLTTCALDYQTWSDHYTPGCSEEDGVRIMRFSVPSPRDPDQFNEATRIAYEQGSEAAAHAWMDAQGPNAPGLLGHLRRDGATYDAVLFVPYLYATTVRGLPLVRDRSVLVPALHDEPPLRLDIFRPIVEGARALIFSTPEEQALALQRFNIAPERCTILGVGVDPPPRFDRDAFRDLTGQVDPYVLCIGRIDASKGSDRLIASHRALRTAMPNGPDLVMIGPAAMTLPDDTWLVTPGFVTEAVKHAAVAGAVALVCPSPYESLSLVLLEAWSHRTPTVVAAASDVLVGQTRRSGGGLWYRDDAEYIECVRLLASTPALCRALGSSGQRFTNGLAWPSVTARLKQTLAKVAGQAAATIQDETE